MVKQIRTEIYKEDWYLNGDSFVYIQDKEEWWYNAIGNEKSDGERQNENKSYLFCKQCGIRTNNNDDDEYRCKNSINPNVVNSE